MFVFADCAKHYLLHPVHVGAIGERNAGLHCDATRVGEPGAGSDAAVYAIDFAGVFGNEHGLACSSIGAGQHDYRVCDLGTIRTCG